MLPYIQTAAVLLSLIINNPAYAAEINAPTPVAESIINFTSTTTVAAYITLKAREKGVDPELALSIAQCESGLVPQQSKHIQKDGTQEQSFGIWQFNLPSWKGMTKEEAMDIVLSTDKAMDLLKEGKAHLWTCYKKPVLSN
jgi:hypothetical protein